MRIFRGSFLLSILLLILISCSASQPPVNYSYEYLDKTRKNAYTEIYNYKYKIEDGERQDINIYVKNYRTFTYIITMESYFGMMLNMFVYKSLKTSQNFASQLRAGPETVHSLQEAIELALDIYIHDFKAKEIN